MSQNDNTDDHDVRDESMRKTTRRGLLAGVGLAGLGLFGSGGASGNLGGGPDAGDMTNYQVPYFRVPESDLDTPGVVGRRVEITAGGSSYSAGDQLVDTGSSWERVSAGYDSVSADELSNKSDAEIKVYNDGGTYTAIGPQITKKRGTDILEVLADVDSQLTSAAHIHVAAGLYDIDNSYAEGEEWTVETEGLTLTGDGAATHMRLKDNATDSGDGAKLILVNANDVTFANFKIDGNQANNGGFGDGETIQDATDGHNIRVLAEDFVMRGVRSVNSTGDGVEPQNQTRRATITNCIFKSNFEQHVHFGGCQRVTVSNCVMVDEYNNGMVSTHSGANDITQDCVLSNCVLYGGDNNCIEISTGDGTVENFTVDGCIIRSPATDGVQITYTSNGDAVPAGITISDTTIESPGRDGIRVSGAVDVDIDNVTVRKPGNKGIIFIQDANYGHEDVSIKNSKILDPGMSSTSNGIRLNPNDDTFTRLVIDSTEVVSKDSGSDMDVAINSFVSGAGGFVDSKIVGSKLVGFTGEGFSATPDGLKIARNDGDFVNGASGVATFSGDGSKTTFQISHGVANRIASSAAAKLSLTPLTADADADKSISVDFNTIDITFASAPPSGTDNVVFAWSVGHE